MNKRIVIAGSRSGVGKTTISLGLMAALKNRAYKVQPFKVGPDYIDPGFHSLICDSNSYNLDSYFLGTAGVKSLFCSKSRSADISLIEGVMGLFDGKGKKSTSSTAEIAKTLKSPVVLIIDARKVAQSAAAVVYGYKNYDPELNLKGVIINNISSSHHFKLLKEAIKSRMPELSVLGYLPKIEDLKLPERHLGLVPVSETEELNSYTERLIEVMEKYIDLDQLIELAAPAEKLSAAAKHSIAGFSSQFKNQILAADIKVAVASDQAFNFYYQYNLELLKAAGAEIVKLSPLTDTELPEVDAFYLGGGFPESFLKELAANKKFKSDLKIKAESGLPIYAECGGLMYLCSQVENLAGEKFEMLDIISAKIKMTSSLQEMGYREVKALSENLLFKKGERARGHVFHYSKITDTAADIIRSYSYRGQKEGYRPAANILASYLHLHFASNPKIVENFLLKALAYKKSRGA